MATQILDYMVTGLSVILCLAHSLVTSLPLCVCMHIHSGTNIFIFSVDNLAPTQILLLVLLNASSNSFTEHDVLEQEMFAYSES